MNGVDHRTTIAAIVNFTGSDYSFSADSDDALKEFAVAGRCYSCLQSCSMKDHAACCFGKRTEVRPVSSNFSVESRAVRHSLALFVCQFGPVCYLSLFWWLIATFYS